MSDGLLEVDKPTINAKKEEVPGPLGCWVPTTAVGKRAFFSTGIALFSVPGD